MFESISTRSSRGRPVGLLALAALWALFLTLIGSPEILLFTAPVFVLAAMLAFGCYAGGELIQKLSRAVHRRDQRPEAPSTSAILAPGSPIRASLLIALNLAGRAPPAAPA